MHREGGGRKQGNGLSQKPLSPVTAVTPEYAVNVVFINGRTKFQDGQEGGSGVRGGNDPHLIGKGDLGIGNYGIRNQCMGTSTAGTFDAADAKSQEGRTAFQVSKIITVDSEAAGDAAGTGKLMELKVGK